MKGLVRESFPRCGMDMAMSKTIALMENEAFCDILVFDDDKLMGVFSPDHIARSRIDIDDAHLRRHIRTMPAIQNHGDTKGYAKGILDSGTHVLPVREGRKIIGQVHAFDILRLLKDELQDSRVSQVPGREVGVLNGRESIARAREMMRYTKAGSIIITDDYGDVIGCFGAFDYVSNINLLSHRRDQGARGKRRTRAFTSEKVDIDALPVQNFVFSKPKVIVNSQTNIPDVIRLMEQYNLISIVVEDAGRIIRARDILRYFLGMKAPTTRLTEMVGLQEIGADIMTRYEVQDIAERCARKLGRIMKKDVLLKVHIKNYKSAQKGKEHKYSIRVQLISPGDTISVDKAYDWDLKLAVQKAMRDIENRVRNIHHG